MKSLCDKSLKMKKPAPKSNGINIAMLKTQNETKFSSDEFPMKKFRNWTK